MGAALRIALLVGLMLAPSCQYVSGVTELGVEQRELGEPCTHDWLCASGHCADEICCDRACDTACEGCRSADALGTCTPHPETIDPDNDCEGLGTCDGSGNCADGAHLWSLQLGGPMNDRNPGIAVDSAGNLVMAMTFEGSVTVGEDTHTSVGLWDVLLVKLDSGGNVLWSKSFGDPGRDIAHGIAVDSEDNLFVVGTFTDQLDIGTGGLARANGMAQFVAKFGPNKDSRWVQIFNDTGSPPSADPPFLVALPLSVAVDPSGDVYVAGRTSGFLQENSALVDGRDDVFVAKLRGSNGVVDWRESFDAAQPEHTMSYPALQIVINGSGQPVVAGTFKTQLRAGSFTLLSEGNEQVNPDDLFCVRLDPAGAVQAAVRFGDDAPQNAAALAAAEGDAIVVAGTFQGTLALDTTEPLNSEGDPTVGGDIYLAKLDGDFGHLWSKSYTGNGPKAPFTVSVDGSHNIIMAGAFLGGGLDFGGGALSNFDIGEPTVGEEDIFVAKFSGSGVHLLSKRYGQGGAQLATASAIDADLNVHLAGHFNGLVGFGGTRLSPRGLTDVFVAKLTP